MRYNRYSQCPVKNNACLAPSVAEMHIGDTVYTRRDPYKYTVISTSPFEAKDSDLFATVSIMGNGDVDGLLYAPEGAAPAPGMEPDMSFDSFEEAQKDAISRLPTLVRGVSLEEVRKKLFHERELSVPAMERLCRYANDLRALPTIFAKSDTLTPEMNEHVKRARANIVQDVDRVDTNVEKPKEGKKAQRPRFV